MGRVSGRVVGIRMGLPIAAKFTTGLIIQDEESFPGGLRLSKFSFNIMAIGTLISTV